MLLAPALRLAAAAYASYNSTRHFLYRQGILRSLGLPCPVISIGNLTNGGTGKTPFVEYLARHYGSVHKMPTMILQVCAAAAVAVWLRGCVAAEQPHWCLAALRRRVGDCRGI